MVICPTVICFSIKLMTCWFVYVFSFTLNKIIITYILKKSVVCLLLLFQAAHGFMKTHKWRDTIGAFINVEASGSGGPGRI